jgi:hypothetical protein
MWKWLSTWQPQADPTLSLTSMFFIIPLSAKFLLGSLLRACRHSSVSLQWTGFKWCNPTLGTTIDVLEVSGSHSTNNMWTHSIVPAHRWWVDFYLQISDRRDEIAAWRQPIEKVLKTSSKASSQDPVWTQPNQMATTTVQNLANFHQQRTKKSIEKVVSWH